MVSSATGLLPGAPGPEFRPRGAQPVLSLSHRLSLSLVTLLRVLPAGRFGNKQFTTLWTTAEAPACRILASRLTNAFYYVY